MMEQPDSRKGHHHSILITGCDHIVVSNRAAWLCNILHAAFMGALDVVPKREEDVYKRQGPPSYLQMTG